MSPRTSSYLVAVARCVAVMLPREGLHLTRAQVLFSAGDRVLLDLHGLREVEADQVYTTAVSSSRPATQVCPLGPLGLYCFPTHVQYRVWGRSLHNCVMRPFAVISVPAMMHEVRLGAMIIGPRALRIPDLLSQRVPSRPGRPRQLLQDPGGLWRIGLPVDPVRAYSCTPFALQLTRRADQRQVDALSLPDDALHPLPPQRRPLAGFSILQSL